MNRYQVNETFLSLQGEGVRAGTVNLFVRFSGCNLTCRKETHGFDCDTEFVSGISLSLDELVNRIVDESGDCRWVIFTGGEPGLQLDKELIDRLHDVGFKCAVETNGSLELPLGLDWVCVSPKVAEHAIRQKTADEVKYVRSYGQGIPRPVVRADHYVISPAFSGDILDPKDLQWCIQLVKENPLWRLSVQQHKFLKVR